MTTVNDGRMIAMNNRTLYEHSYAVLPRRGDRNVDVIPGLAYFARATEILGTLQGEFGLSNIQANLLASLYCGQLCSSLESWSWLSQACRNCLLLMRGYVRPQQSQAPANDSSHLFLADAKKDAVRVELIYFAYWTCYQFERWVQDRFRVNMSH